MTGAFALLMLLPLAFAAQAAAARQAPPELTAPVNDFAGVIDAGSRDSLDRLIRALQAASGDVIVVATVKTFQPAADIRVYANEMFENHGKGIGQKGRDNGLLMVLAVDDREVWVEVGYDLEAIITDGFAGETSREVMIPHFREGDYGDGLLAGATALAQRIAQARNVTLEGVPAPRTAARQPRGSPIPYPLLLFLFIVGMQALAGVVRRLTGGRKYRRRGRWHSHVGPFGGGYGGGGWSSGGGFGGGFGGFGGGRSGGGGGGGSW